MSFTKVWPLFVKSVKNMVKEMTQLNVDLILGFATLRYSMKTYFLSLFEKKRFWHLQNIACT